MYYLDRHWCTREKSFNPFGTGVFLGQLWTGGGGRYGPPPWYLSSEASEEIGAKHNYCDDFSDDYFEVYNISVAQNLTILEPIMRFCWKSQKIGTTF